MPKARPPQDSNRLLALLPSGDKARILVDSTLVDLPFGHILEEQDDPIRHVYFPTAGYISMLITVDKQTLEVGMIGDEGMCGHSLALGANTAPLRSLVQGSGMSLRIRTTAFRQHLATSAALRQLMASYTSVLQRQLAQSCACTRFHTVEARLARWLLMTQDRAHADDFDVTQEFLAYMLGVRRVGVSAAARALQSQNLISYRRGHLTVVDRTGLVAAACICYRSDLEIYRRVLGVGKPVTFIVPQATAVPSQH